MLVNMFVQKCQEESISAIYLHSDIGNAFYEKLGFKSVTTKVYRTSILMVKVLDESMCEVDPDYF